MLYPLPVDRLVGHLKAPHCANSRGTATTQEWVTTKTIAFTPQAAARFWSHVDRTSDCWIWTGQIGKDGYGRAWHEGKRIGAHRIALALETGTLPSHLFALHSCDTPACVNPSHLRWGTHAENMADATDRCAVYPPKGSINPKAKLTEPQVLGILTKLAAGVRSREIVSTYGISAQTVSDIKYGRTWTHIDRTAVSA